MRAKLTLVPTVTPDPVQAVRERVKAMPRPEGWLQCNKCGSRTMFTAVNGSWIDGKGQYHRGTVVYDKLCLDCHKRGIHSPMMPSRPKPAT